MSNGNREFSARYVGAICAAITFRNGTEVLNGGSMKSSAFYMFNFKSE